MEPLYFGFFVFFTIQCVYTIREAKKLIYQAENALRIENEMSHTRIAIMLSQIQPHFLYNSLLGIKRLCEIEPKKAAEAIAHFSYFLRGNMDSLSCTSLVTFEQEKEHVMNYLYMEQMRFEERLTVSWDLEYTDFLLPTLTIQPLVENAVHYGITKKREGGTITIRTMREQDVIAILIEDDGVGFDISEKKEDGRSHVGIENVRQRLIKQCDATLMINSTKGIGTVVRIEIPFRGDFCEDNSSR